MSNKSLLQESEIRKMMKFANIGALSNTFVKKINEAGYYSEEEEDEDPMAVADDEPEMDVDVVDDEEEDQEEMFNEVVRRVAKRLMKK